MTLLYNRRVLVTGGAGYIGSHTALALNKAGYDVTVFDNLSTGLRTAVIPPCKLIVADLGDRGRIEQVVRDGDFAAVMHFAASTVVPESVERPLHYYSNNVATTISLLEAVERYRVPRLIFSSSAAVYGIPESCPVSEDAMTVPINPYGHTKLMAERIVRDFAESAPWFRFGILRYFNVAGCDPGGQLGQNDPNATHLIKAVCQAALGRRASFEVFGSDFDTLDGTAVRDFIHVTDLSRAHLAVLNTLEGGSESCIFNCGYGVGYTVRQVIDVVQAVSGTKFPVTIGPRRAGDPPKVVADAGRIMKFTSWRPRYDDMNLIVRSAFDWERRLT